MLCVAGRRGTWLVITRAAVKTMFVSDKRGIIQARGRCTCCRAQQSLPAATLQALALPTRPLAAPSLASGERVAPR